MSNKYLLAGAVSIGILVSFIASLLFLENLGKRARVYAGPGLLLSDKENTATVVNTSKELYDLYKSRKVHGRILIHLGKYLHALDIDTEKFISGIGPDADSMDDLLSSFENDIFYGNVFWVASQGNIVRDLYFIQPHEMFIKRLNSIDERDPDVIIKNKGGVIIHDWGARRTISDKMPEIKEPVLLNIDASVFEEIKPKELLLLLQNSSVKTDLVTLTLSQDNPEVSDRCREDLLLFANIFLKEKGQAR